MNEQQHNMTGAWALNALDADERARVEEYLAQDPAAADEARSFTETAGELAQGLDPVAPRPELKSSVMARIAQTRQLAPNPPQDEESSTIAGHDEAAIPRSSADNTHRAEVSDTAPSTKKSGGTEKTGSGDVVPMDRYRSSVRRMRWLAAAAAVLMVTTISGLGLWGTERAAQEEAQATIEAMKTEQAGAAQEQSMVSTIMASDDAAHLTIPSEEGGSLHLMYSREQQSMIIQSADLPPLPSGSVYQLWLIDDAPKNAGLLTGPDQSVMVHREVPPAAQLGLTVEPTGGSEQPTSDVIAQGAL